MLGQDCIQSVFCTWRRHDTVPLTNSEIQLIIEVFQQPNVNLFIFLLTFRCMSVCLTGIYYKMMQISMLKPLSKNILAGIKLNTEVLNRKVPVQSFSSLSYLPYKTRTKPGSSRQKQKKQSVFHSPHKSVRGGKTAPALCRGREESFSFPPTLCSPCPSEDYNMFTHRKCSARLR